MTEDNTTKTTLGRIEAHYEHIARSLDDIKENISFKEGSPLRDSVKVLVRNQMDEQNSTCMKSVRELVENVSKDAAASARDEHEKEFHPRSSQAPRSRSVWEGFMPAFIKALPYIIAALGLGGGGLIATQNTANTAPMEAPTDNGD